MTVVIAGPHHIIGINYGLWDIIVKIVFYIPTDVNFNVLYVWIRLIELKPFFRFPARPELILYCV